MNAEETRQQLEQMLREIDSTAAIIEAEGAGDSSELSHVDQHPGDTASELTDADSQNAILDNSAEHRTEIEAALARLEDGSYGTCVDCGKKIPAARLDVRPEAARCVEDQAKAEAAAG